MIEPIPSHEDVRTEFKASWSATAQKTLIAFANSLGGDLFFGVSDSGEPIGLSKHEFDEISRSVSLFCREGVEPAMSYLLRQDSMTTSDKKLVLKISVAPGTDRPYGFRGRRYTNGAYIRDGASSVLATEEEIRRMICESDPVPWESRLSRQSALTFDQASEVFRKNNVAFSPQHYLALHLTNARGDALNLGELLSDQNTAQITFGIFSEDSAALVTKSFSGSILRQMDEAFLELQRHNPSGIRKTGDLSSERFYRWPPKALRESLVNCVVHRDYAQKEPTKVSVFPDRFEFLSYGNIPGDLSVDEIIVEGVSCCRNPNLAAIFQRLGWMENYGSGFPLLWQEYSGTGAEPKLEATRRIFRIMLPQVVPAESKNLISRGAELFLQCESLSTSDLMQRLHISRTSANTIVNCLMKDKAVEKFGNGKLTRYRSLVRSATS